jgi:hypothetical protein
MNNDSPKEVTLGNSQFSYSKYLAENITTITRKFVGENSEVRKDAGSNGNSDSNIKAIQRP